MSALAHLRMALAWAEPLTAEQLTHADLPGEGQGPVMMGGDPVTLDPTITPPAFEDGVTPGNLDERLRADQGEALRRVIYHCTAALCSALGAAGGIDLQVPEVDE